MPVQKGKKRRRVRNRGAERQQRTPTQRSAAAPVASPPSGRRSWQLPPWMNLAFGVLMLGAGVFFFALPQKGMSTGSKAFFLLTYGLVAGFYFFRAYRGYRRRSS